MITFTAQDETDGFIFEECAFMDGLTLTGEGSYDWEEDVFTLEVQVGAADCLFSYRRSGEEYSVEDNCPTDQFSG